MRQQRSILVIIAGVLLSASVVASSAEAKGFRVRFGTSAQAAVARPNPASASVSPGFAARPPATRPAASPPARSGGVVFIPTGRERREAEPGPKPVQLALPALPTSGAAVAGPAEPAAKVATIVPRQAKGFVIVSGARRGFDELR